MSTILTLLKLELKKTDFRLVNLKGRTLWQIIATAFLGLTFLGAIFYAILYVSRTFARLKLEEIYVTFMLSVLIILTTITQVAGLIKGFASGKDNEIYFKLPVKRSAIFAAKALKILIKQAITIFLFLALTLISFLISAGFSYTVYIKLALIALIIGWIPGLIGMILYRPLYWIFKKLDKNIFVKLISIILVIGIVYGIYVVFGEKVITLMNATGDYVAPEIINNINSYNRFFPLGNFLARLILYQPAGKFALRYAILAVSLNVLGFLSWFLLGRATITKSSSQKAETEIKKKEEKVRRPINSIIVKELKYIFRNSIASFQVIVINILMPVFVVMTTKITVSLGQDIIGSSATVAVALLTSLVFVLLSSSFLANIVSSDKEAHYLNKIMPVKYHTTILIRAGIVVLINLFSLILSISLLPIFGFITPTQYLIILIIGILFLLGYAALQIYSDLKHPDFVYGEANSIQVLTNLMLGLIIVLFLSTLLMIFEFVKTAPPGGLYVPIAVGYTTVILIAALFMFVAIIKLALFFRRETWKRF